MKKLASALISLLCISQVSAFENGALNLTVPTNLIQNEATFAVRHRFFGEAKDLNTLFGSDTGGNIGLLFRYAPITDLVLNFSRVRHNREFTFGAAYALHSDYAHAQLQASAFEYTLGSEKELRRNLFTNLALQSNNLLEHLILTSNIGFDGYNEKVGAGFGVDYNFENIFPIGMTFTERMSIVAEYFPRIQEKSGITGKYDAYAVGLKSQTFGHHFEIMLTNSTAMDARNMMLGTNSNDIHFGFNINRKF